MNLPSAVMPDVPNLTHSGRPDDRSICNIYHVHPLAAGPMRDWSSHFEHAARMGMSHVCLAPPFEPASSGNIFAHATFERLHPALGFEGSADEGLQQILDMARSCGLGLMLDVAPASLAADGPISQQHRNWFVSPNITQI